MKNIVENATHKKCIDLLIEDLRRKREKERLKYYSNSKSRND